MIHPRRCNRPVAMLIASLAAAPGVLAATDGTIAPTDARLTLQLEPSTPAPATQPPVEPTPGEFAKEGTWWWSTGGSFADDLSSNRDYGVYAGVRYFIADGWEFGGQLNLRYASQKGEDAVGINPVMIFRHHFLVRDDWTMFADVGIGFMVSTDNIPDGSTSFNFTPRAGIGFTRCITDAGARLEVGLTWMHISNARIKGDFNNESRDAPQLYASVIFPF